MATIVARTDSCGDRARRIFQRTWSGQRLRQLRIVPQTPGPLAGGLLNLAVQEQGVVAVPDDNPPLFLDCSRQPTFVDPQAAICQPTNLQPQFKSGFEAAPSLATTRASPFSRPSTTQSPQRSSPAMASRSWPHPERRRRRRCAAPAVVRPATWSRP